MHPTLNELVRKHFTANKPLPEELSAFLLELDQAMQSSQEPEEQTSVQKSEQTIQSVLDALPFGVTLIDKDQTILYANQSALETMGCSDMQEIIGQTCKDSQCPTAEGQCPNLDLKQKGNRSERKLVTKNGDQISVLKSATPIIIDGKQVLLESFIDVSERSATTQDKETEFQRRDWLAENVTAVIKQIAAKEQNKELFNTLVQEIADKFNYNRVQYLVYNPAASNLKAVTAAGKHNALPNAQTAIVPLGRGVIGKAAETLSTVVVRAPHINFNDYPDLLSKNTQTEIALPLAVNNELIGILDIQSEHPDQIDHDTQVFLEMLTTQAAYFTQSIQYKNEMQDQLNELSILQRMTSTEGWKTFSDMSSLSAKRYIYDQDLQSTIPWEGEQNLKSDRALIRPLEIRGQTIGALGVQAEQNQDLTEEEKMLLDSVSSEVAEALERARLFETSQRSAAELAVLNEMGSSFSQAQREEAITEIIHTYTAKLMETPQFYVAFYHPEEEEISFPHVVMNGVKVTEEHPNYDLWQPRPAGVGLTGHIIENRQPILIDSQAESKLEEMGIPFSKFGGETQSWLGVPMIIGNRVLGVISVQCEDTPNLYNQHHLDLLTTIASQAAVAINNTRLLLQEQERAEQEHLVRTVTDKVRRGTDTASILQVALEELSTILNADISTVQLGDKDHLLAQKNETTDHNPNPNGFKSEE